MVIPTVEGITTARSIVSLSSEAGNLTCINPVSGQSCYFSMSTTGKFFTG